MIDLDILIPLKLDWNFSRKPNVLLEFFKKQIRVLHDPIIKYVVCNGHLNSMENNLGESQKIFIKKKPIFKTSKNTMDVQKKKVHIAYSINFYYHSIMNPDILIPLKLD